MPVWRPVLPVLSIASIASFRRCWSWMLILLPVLLLLNLS